jgi:hypothetical protein
MRVIGEIANPRLIGLGYLIARAFGYATPASFRDSGWRASHFPYYATGSRSCNKVLQRTVISRAKVVFVVSSFGNTMIS